MATAFNPPRIRSAFGPTEKAPTGTTAPVNLGDAERWASLVGGGALAVYGLTRGSLPGLALALVGGSLVYRGVSGHCPLYGALGLSTAPARGPATSVPAQQGIKVEKTFVINRSPEELYRFWRDFENLPRFMGHLESVRTMGNRSHWVARAPLGMTVEWDAEVISEQPNELIGWRSLEGADVDSAGSVHFTRVPGGRSTEVRVVLKYNPPAGQLGAAVARWFGEEPHQQIAEDLHRFKEFMEAGEIPMARR